MKDPRKHIYYRVLKETAKDLLRDCETSEEAQKFGKELAEVFFVALQDVALDKWYDEGL